MNDDQEDKKFHMMPGSDMVLLGIAGACLVGFLYLLFGPSPFAELTEKARQAKSAPSEVTVSLPEKAKN
jgi:hypothetical protein